MKKTYTSVNDWTTVLQALLHQPIDANTVQLSQLERPTSANADAVVVALEGLTAAPVVNTDMVAVLAGFMEAVLFCTSMPTRAVLAIAGVFKKSQYNGPRGWTFWASKYLEKAIGRNHPLARALWDNDHFNGNGAHFAALAIYKHNTDDLNMFLERVDPRVNKHELLQSAVNAANEEALKILLSRCVPNKNKTDVLSVALFWESGHKLPKWRAAKMTPEEIEAFNTETARKIVVVQRMIGMLRPHADIDQLFFSRPFSQPMAELIPYLSKRSMRRLQSEEYAVVRQHPSYLKRVLTAHIDSEGAMSAPRKM